MNGSQSLAPYLGEWVCLITLTEARTAQTYVLTEVTAHGVTCADHRRRLFVSYDDLATRRYKLVGSDAAKAVMSEVHRRARTLGV